MNISIQFLGAAGTVTGSRHLLQLGERRILVDCGLFQGLKELRLQNHLPFPVDPGSIDAVILTHAHLDHSGCLPLLVRQGFKGPIYCTSPTEELTRILLADSARIQEEDTDFSNRKGFSKHSPALPLYSVEEAALACRHLEAAKIETWNELFNGIRFRLRNSGHILGSAFVEIDAAGKRLVFSGDLGRTQPFLLRSRESIAEADYLVLESTYGDRTHPTQDPEEALRQVIMDTVEKGGQLMIASFAVGRAQDILYLLAKLKRESRIPSLPIYIDSPLATGATDILMQHRSWHSLGDADMHDMASVATVVNDRQKSKELLDVKGSSIVIAGSGMVSGGRILHHLAHRVSDPKNTLLLVGFQAPGTRGAQLQCGASEIKMHGRYFAVRAAVCELPGLSAHADQGEIISWLRGFTRAPKTTFLVHGEPQAADCLRVKLKDTLGWSSVIPKALEKFEL